MLRNEQEISDKIQEYFRKEHWVFSGVTTQVVDYGEGEIFVIIEIFGRDQIELTFDVLQNISRLIECKEIDIKFENYKSGCGTCGYGSKQDITFICW